MEIKIENFFPYEERLETFCIGIVDIVESSKITSKLNKSMVCPFYRIFLDEMSHIVRKSGVVVKNIGDSLLYYFPDTTDTSNKRAFAESLDCCMKMLDSRHFVNSKLQEKGLPSISYRISLDFGLVIMTKPDCSSSDDIFGPTVNLCAKMNKIAAPNTLVIGGDLHQIVKAFSEYKFMHIAEYHNGLKLHYPVYSTKRLQHESQ